MPLLWFVSERGAHCQPFCPPCGTAEYVHRLMLNQEPEYATLPHLAAPKFAGLACTRCGRTLTPLDAYPEP